MVSVADPLSARPSLWSRGQIWLRQGLTHPAPGAVPAAAVTRAGLLIWAPVWFSGGIGLWFWLRFEPGVVSYGCAVGMVLAVAMLSVAARYAALQGRLPWLVADRLMLLAMAVTLFAGGFLAVGLRAHLVAAPVLSFRYYGPVEGRVIGIDRSSGDRMRIMLDQVVLENTSARRTPERVRISLMGPEALPQPGARVMLTAHLSPPPPPSEPGGFDFRRNAWFERLGGVGYSRNPIMTVSPPEPGGTLIMARWRMRLSALIQQEIGGQPGAVAAALISGDRSGISEQTNEIMRISSLYHIISISGLHMSMLAGMVFGVLRAFGAATVALGVRTDRPFHKWAAGGAFLAALVYLGLSGGGVATERSFLMIALMLVAVLAGRRAITLRSIAFGAMILLLLAPESLISPSFQMSFAATVALVLSYRWWCLIAPFLPKILAPLALLLFTALVAGLATGPFAAAHFGRIAPYGMLANLLAVPIVGMIVMPMGLIAVILAPIGLAGPPLWLMGQGTWAMLWVADWISGFGGADVLLPAPPAEVLPLLATGMTLLALTCDAVMRRRHLIRAAIPLIGAAMMLAALAIWVTASRPQILVSAEGNAVGILTPSGRAMSQAKGGSFYVRGWLENDGDPADQAQSAARPLWTGPKSARRAEVHAESGVVTLLHISPTALGDIVKSCSKNDLIIVNGDLSEAGPENPNACKIYDRKYLGKIGGFSMRVKNGNPVIMQGQDAIGLRIWTGGKPRRSNRSRK